MNNSIKKRLKEKKKSLGWLSRTAKISRHHLSNIANDWVIPRIDTAHKIAKALECDIDDIWVFED